MTTSPHPLSREDARAAVLDACRQGDATLDSRIDDLWAAKADPERMSRLLARHWAEVATARALLAEAADARWWPTVDAERLRETCRLARIWAAGDPVCADLERGLASHLRSCLGIDLAGIPRAARG